MSAGSAHGSLSCISESPTSGFLYLLKRFSQRSTTLKNYFYNNNKNVRFRFDYDIFFCRFSNDQSQINHSPCLLATTRPIIRLQKSNVKCSRVDRDLLFCFFFFFYRSATDYVRFFFLGVSNQSNQIFITSKLLLAFKRLAMKR